DQPALVGLHAGAELSHVIRGTRAGGRALGGVTDSAAGSDGDQPRQHGDRHAPQWSPATEDVPHRFPPSPIVATLPARGCCAAIVHCGYLWTIRIWSRVDVGGRGRGCRNFCSDGAADVSSPRSTPLRPAAGPRPRSGPARLACSSCSPRRGPSRPPRRTPPPRAERARRPRSGAGADERLVRLHAGRPLLPRDGRSPWSSLVVVEAGLGELCLDRLADQVADERARGVGLLALLSD